MNTIQPVLILPLPTPQNHPLQHKTFPALKTILQH
jgi:hypothetical protein